MSKQLDHMARRHGQLKSLRKTAAEFGTSKSTVHRKLKKTAPAQDMMRQGYTKLPD